MEKVSHRFLEGISDS